MKEQTLAQEYLLKIASLNYSGVLISPYQFYDKQDEKQLLISSTFTSFVKQKYPQFAQGKGQNFKWNMQSLDLRWKIRYSPTSVLDVGINKQKNIMMNEQQFNKQWYLTHDKCKQEIRKSYYEKTYKPEQIQQKMQLQVQRCRQFDLFCYKTLMKVYCGIDDINKMQNMDCKVYLEKKKQDFSKPYLHQQQKVKNTVQSFKKMNYDVYYVQQGNKNLIDAFKLSLSNYQIIHRSDVDSLILIKRSLYPKEYNFQKANRDFFAQYSEILKKQKNILLSPQELQKKFNFNQDSIFQIMSNVILINVHLSSKSKKNSSQISQILSQVQNIVQYFPQYQIIIGGDFNTTVNRSSFHFLQRLKVPIQSGKKRFSVKKKRSMMQPQRHKAHFLDQVEKDFIFSTFLIIKEEVNLIDGTNIEDFQQLPLLPRTQHPYDHYMITSTLRTSNNLNTL